MDHNAPRKSQGGSSCGKMREDGPQTSLQTTASSLPVNPSKQFQYCHIHATRCCGA